MITTLLIALAPAITEAAPFTLVLTPLDPMIVAVAQDEEAIVVTEWTGSVALSAVTTTGNTDQTAFSADADAELRRDVDRYTAKAYFNYATDSGSGSSALIDRKMGASLKYDYFLTEDEKTYVYGNTGVAYDASANLDLRLLVGAGMGYQFYETDDFKLAGEGGLSYVSEEYTTSKAEYLALRLAANVFKKLGEKTTLTSAAEAYPNVDDTSDVYGKVDTKINTSLTESMFASFQWVLDFDNTPAAGSDRTDNRFVLALGWSF